MWRNFCYAAASVYPKTNVWRKKNFFIVSNRLYSVLLLRSICYKWIFSFPISYRLIFNNFSFCSIRFDVLRLQMLHGENWYSRNIFFSYCLLRRKIWKKHCCAPQLSFHSWCLLSFCWCLLDGWGNCGLFWWHSLGFLMIFVIISEVHPLRHSRVHLIVH